MFRRCLELIKQHGSTSEALLKGFSGANQLEISAEGSWIQGSEGDHFLDCGSFSKFLLGHSPTSVIQALHEQLETLSGTSRLLTNHVYSQAITSLAALFPAPLTKVMLLNTGAEAVEAAIKCARIATNRRKIAHLSYSYHGKTAGALSLTDSAHYKHAAHPLLQDVICIDRDDLSNAEQYLQGRDIAAVFIEPIQGEGGIYEIPSQALKRLAKACSKHGTLLIADEIQCGLGRSGSLWAFQQGNIQPDMVLVGKALGAGVVPVSALVATPTAFKPYDQNGMFFQSTYAANPLACATVRAVVWMIREDSLETMAQEKGAWLKLSLTRLTQRFPNLFKEVRGRGLFLGLNCQSPQIASFFLQACMAQKLLITPCLTAPQVVRITPSAYVDGIDLDGIQGRLTEAALGVERKILLKNEENNYAYA